jgi:hypothetical protein
LLALATIYRLDAEMHHDHDPSQDTDSVFHHLWSDLLGPAGPIPAGPDPGIPQIQIHGFADRTPPHEEIVVSTGPGRRPLWIAQRVADALEGLGRTVTRNWLGVRTGTAWEPDAATAEQGAGADPNLVAEKDNRQGEDANKDHRYRDWVHVENTGFLRRDSTLWQPMMKAMAGALDLHIQLDALDGNTFDELVQLPRTTADGPWRVRVRFDPPLHGTDGQRLSVSVMPHSMLVPSDPPYTELYEWCHLMFHRPGFDEEISVDISMGSQQTFTLDYRNGVWHGPF